MTRAPKTLPKNASQAPPPPSVSEGVAAVSAPVAAEAEGAPSARKAATTVHTRRVVIECNTTLKELTSGKLVPIPNASDIFKPDYDMSKEEVVETMSALDMSKGIISNIQATSMYNQTGEAVTVSLNLFHNADGEQVGDHAVNNTVGWVHTASATDFGTAVTKGDGAFTNVLCLMPYEKTRQPIQVYEPNNILQDRLVREYGSFTQESLREGIVSFEGQPFCYVDKEHVIMQIARKNWDHLGLNIDTQNLHENKYYKLNTELVNRIIDELYQNVLCRIPYTSFHDLQARFSCQSPHAEVDQDEPVKVITEFQFDFTYPTIEK